MSVEVNYLAVLLAAVGAMMVGAIWYSPSVFGAAWRKTFKQNKKVAKRDAPLVFLITFVAALLTAYVLAHMGYLANRYFGNSFLQDVMTTAIILWVGFSVPAILGGLFEQRRKLSMLIQIGCSLITLEVMAIIIGLLKP